jgi:RNase H-fold protein (predicted Holliday junction resolvase)
VEANRVLREAGLGPSGRAKAVDQVAASLLLQGYLDSCREPVNSDLLSNEWRG